MSDHIKTGLNSIAGLTGESIPVCISGDCMKPVLADGERVRVQKSSHYHTGEILVYCNQNGKLIAHRMLGYYYWKGVWRLLIKADSAKRADGGVLEADIVGRVLDYIPSLTVKLKCLSDYFKFMVSRIYFHLNPFS